MIPLKRSNPAEDGPDDAKRTKHTDVWDDKDFATVEEAMAEIATLKCHLDAAVRFINQKELTASAPESLRPVLHSRLGSKALVRALRDNIDDVAERLMEETTYQNGVTGDDLSSAMAEFLPAIRDIAECSDSDALEAAYNVLWYAKDNSYDEEGSGNGDRPSDDAFDEFLVELIAKRTEIGHVWDWEKDLRGLREEARDRGEFGVEPWYPKSLKALEDLVAAKKDGA
ncbi:hypothetical protein QBC44DRAFT_379474 [Cladorrhinum sp. PSN332]|nr:hypothetical protein QBC44DRAFT_379474 [Cladorrhinum sp. PSN332]